MLGIALEHSSKLSWSTQLPLSHCMCPYEHSKAWSFLLAGMLVTSNQGATAG